MEPAVMTTDAAALLERYCALLKTGDDPLPLPVSGGSMAPFLIPGRDSVLLARPGRRLRRGDMVLYRRTSGAYVLHRIVACQRGGSYVLAGDAQCFVERGIRDEQIAAVVCAVVRNGRRLKPGSFWWEFFARVWSRMIPLRGALCRAYAGLTWFRRRQE